MNEALVNVSVGVAGKYKLVANKHSEDGSVCSSRDLTGWFDNLITNLGLNSIGNGVNGYIFSYGAVGTGNTAPANSDTQLQAQAAYTSNEVAVTHGAATSSPYYRYVRVTYRFNPGEATGNFSEVGVGNLSGSIVSTFSRSLIRDTGGNPTTVTVAADESLDIIYEFRIYYKTTDTTANITVNGTSYTFTIRPYRVTSALNSAGYMRTVNSLNSPFTEYIGTAYTGPQPDMVSDPSGQYLGSSSTPTTWAAYTAGNYYRDSTGTFGISSAEASGNISLIAPSSYSAQQYSIGISPAITKAADQRLQITVRTSWARYAP